MESTPARALFVSWGVLLGLAGSDLLLSLACAGAWGPFVGVAVALAQAVLVALVFG